MRKRLQYSAMMRLSSSQRAYLVNDELVDELQCRVGRGRGGVVRQGGLARVCWNNQVAVPP